MNISILIGRIATDLELKQTANGKSYLGFKESEQASRDDVQKILELQNQIMKGEQQ